MDKVYGGDGMMQDIFDLTRCIIYILKGAFTMNDITTFISTCGFPIACSVFLLWQAFRQDERNAAQYEELRKTIEGNTKALNQMGKTLENLKHEFE